MEDFILGQGYGYGFALGIGAGFALLMVVISNLLSRYMGEVQSSERFSTASRSVKSGLIASSTVSAWCWPATLLSSGAWGYSYGISGPYLYAIGGAVQITLFSFLAIQIKRNSPGCHTVAQLISVRFGKEGHWCYLAYCIGTNILVSSLLLLGGSQGFASTTGMHVVAASFLLPLGVICYTLFGGLKATFISDWIHTVIIYVIMLVGCFMIYVGSPLIGSPVRMYELLKEADIAFPNTTGTSYLSFHDKDMLLLAFAVTLGGLCSVFGDPGYSQRAIASDSQSVFSGYMVGGICWFVIPWALGSSAGLACRALLTNPALFTYPNQLTDEQVNAGMPVIFGLAAVLGKSGAAAGLLMLFMSVTSATSAELIAFSSICTYDIYQTYINPSASGKQLVRVAHATVIGFGLFMAIIAVVFNYLGVTVGWLLSFMGIILSPEVSAITLAIFWKKMSKESFIIGSVVGTLTGIACWIGSTYAYADGIINKDTVMVNQALLIGNIASLASAFVCYVVISLIKPSSFDFKVFSTAFHAGDDADQKEKDAMETTEGVKDILKTHAKWAGGINIVATLGGHIIIPVAYYASNYIFSKTYFVLWIVIMLIWLLISSAYIVFFPLWQGRHSIKRVLMSILRKSKDVEDENSSAHSSVEFVNIIVENKNQVV